MAFLAGTYKFESQENYPVYLQSLGVSEAASQKSLIEDTIVIGPIEKDKVTLSLNGHVVVFILDKELEYDLFKGFKRPSTASIDGNKLTVKTKIMDDGSITQEQVFQTTMKGLVNSISNSFAVKAERRYKRV